MIMPSFFKFYHAILGKKELIFALLLPVRVLLFLLYNTDENEVSNLKH